MRRLLSSQKISYPIEFAIATLSFYWHSINWSYFFFSIHRKIYKICTIPLLNHWTSTKKLKNLWKKICLTSILINIAAKKLTALSIPPTFWSILKYICIHFRVKTKTRSSKYHSASASSSSLCGLRERKKNWENP